MPLSHATRDMRHTHSCSFNTTNHTYVVGFNLGAEGGPQMPELEELLKGMEGMPDMGEGKDKCLLM